MDVVEVHTVGHTGQHYDNLGNESEKGGFYPPFAAGSRTRILLLNIGLAEPLLGKQLHDIVNSGQILTYSVEARNSQPVEVMGKLPLPDGIDLSNSNRRMYWSNMQNVKENDGSIQSAFLDGTDVRYVVPPGEVHTPKQIQIDQTAERIYYCDREGLSVCRCNLDGSQREIIYQSGDWKTEPHKKNDATFWPIGIAISRNLNKFFWSQKGHSKANEGRIFSACLDLPPGSSGANRPDIEVVASDLPECIDLEFDDDKGILYWTDRGELPFGNTLNKKQIIGRPPAAEGLLGREIIAQGFGECIGLRLDKENDCLYVTDLGGRLWKCATKVGLKEKLYEGSTHAYTGLALFKI